MEPFQQRNKLCVRQRISQSLGPVAVADFFCQPNRKQQIAERAYFYDFPEILRHRLHAQGMNLFAPRRNLSAQQFRKGRPRRKQNGRFLIPSGKRMARRFPFFAQNLA